MSLHRDCVLVLKLRLPLSKQEQTQVCTPALILVPTVQQVRPMYYIHYIIVQLQAADPSLAPTLTSSHMVNAAVVSVAGV